MGPSLDIVTWNLNGLDPTALGPRVEGALFEVLLGGHPERLARNGAPTVAPPAVLLFQEVVEASFYGQILPHLGAAGYVLFPERPPADRTYFEVIAVRERVLEAEQRPFRYSGMGRCLCRVRLEGFTVFTAHLESLRPGRAARIAQVREVLRAMVEEPNPAVFGGDTNLRAGEAATLAFPPDVCDAWEQLGRPAAGARTWGRARYDQVWLRGLVACSMSALGCAPVPGVGLRPSDHLGLRVGVAPAER